VERITLFADVILPIPVSGTFTYRVPFDLNDRIREGLRVVVQFGQRKIYTALVIRLHEKPPQNHLPKYILSVLDDHPIVTPLQQVFWEWMASYYLCHPGEVMNAALPSALKLASESKVAINPGYMADNAVLNEKEQLLLEALQNRKLIEISEVSKIIDQQKVIPVIKTMIEKGILLMEEELTDHFKPRIESFIQLNPDYSSNDKLQELFNHLEKKARKQMEILMTYIQMSKFGFGELVEVKRNDLLKKAKGTAAQCEQLVSKGVLTVDEKVVSRFDVAAPGISPETIELTEVQQTALDRIRDAFQARDVVLLHGVTSSGKTELYIKLIEETVGMGKQVLYLLPEIALTTQIISRLRKYFGDRIGVYHSRFNKHERVEIWNSVLDHGDVHSGSAHRYDIILGARSSLFLPFSNLGLIIVDEEHDPSFKQMDPAPRYNGRDAAIYLSHLHGAKTILGSATPSIESYFNARNGKYALVEMKERYAGMELPFIRVVDIREEQRQRKMKSNFSFILLDHLAKALEHNEQSILFQNRRGFSLRLECNTCHWMPSCVNCDVTLVYHKKGNQLRCHYCGYVARVPDRCPECNGTGITMRGFGTEKIEEELGILLPKARIARMDLDTTRSKNSYEKIIRDFEEHKIDILVGTQMVTKGLDFDHVSTVCILNADNMLSYPDFRAPERGFQLMAQVSGRSGRKFRQGNVIIQTYNPDHLIIRDVVSHNYTAMYMQQMAERKKFRYPPFYRLILLKVKHKDPDLLNQASDVLAKELRKAFGKRVLGPEFPMVSRVMNYYLKHILLKIEREVSAAGIKERLIQTIDQFRGDKNFGAVKVLIDVDPQ
jgi:primosomal protein N' (replication factor Y)